MEFHINTANLSVGEKKRLYINSVTPALNVDALFSDETSYYRNPAEPTANDTITIRFRTAKNNVDQVLLCYNDVRRKMYWVFSDKLFDYYEATIPPVKEPIEYYFEIHAGKSSCFYHKRGVEKECNPYYNFKIVPGFSTPDWAKGAIFYQIYVDRFYNGDKTNDVVDNEYIYIGEPVHQVKDWNRYPLKMDVREFYGGDLQGVMDKLDYLQGLGVDVLYLNPIFVSPSNHKYDIQDYDYIDPHYGRIIEDDGALLEAGCTDNKLAERYIKRVTSKRNLEASNQIFAELVEEIHSRGMKVILDGVFNHCGSFNKWMDREEIYSSQEGYEAGAYVSRESPYREYFKFRDQNAWPNNASYDGWWEHDTLPKLNYEESKELYRYILEIGKKWVSPPYNADGWRLDVAADLGHSEEFNHQFWRDFRKAVKSANPDAIILAEHYGNPKSWLAGDQWDTIMNYDAFMEPVTWFLTGMEKHSDSFESNTLGNIKNFEGSMNHYMTNFLTPSLYCSMNQLSNHDHSRFLTRTNRKAGRIDTLGPLAASEGINKGVFREAVVIQMTWPGAPTLYYGDEAGVCGFTDPDNRRTYPWGKEDRELIAFHKEIIRIHKENEALRTGSLKFLQGKQNLLCYARFNRIDQLVIIVNNDENSRDVDLSVWAVGVPKTAQLEQLIFTNETGYSVVPVSYTITEGRLKMMLPKHSSVVLKRKN